MVKSYGKKIFFVLNFRSMLQKKFRLLSLPSVAGVVQAIKMLPFSVDLTRGSFQHIYYIFHSGKINILHKKEDIRNFSFIWLTSSWGTRDLAYALSLYTTAKKIPCAYVEQGTSKVSDCMVFALNNLPIPNTLFVPRKEVKDNLELFQKICGYPLIIKDTKGSKGKHSKYVANEEDLLLKLSELPKGKRFFFQQFIPNQYDWGVMVVNGEVVAGEKSYPSEGEFRNNAAHGAKEYFVEVAQIPEDIKNLALKASKSLNLSWSRADIIIDKNTGKPFLLEVNRYPGITLDSDEVVGAYTFLSSHILK